VTVLPVFPLGQALLPGMPLALRVFEERYLVLMTRVLEGDGSFGVVLIERGQEVGGGDHRFGTGTLAQVARCELADGYLSVLARGTRRFEVDAWLPDDPHPRARVRWLPELAWSPELAPVRAASERSVRRSLARASEFSDAPWPSDVALADDPVLAAWQLAGIAPVGPLDRITLLRSPDLAQLLQATADLSASAVEALELAGLDPDPEGTPDG